jgi:hypothetical protein
MTDAHPTTPLLRKLIPADNQISTVKYTPPSPSPDTSSPRTAVANSLSDLNLRNLHLEHQQSPRKRVRTSSLEPEGTSAPRVNGVNHVTTHQGREIDAVRILGDKPLADVAAEVSDLQSALTSNTPALPPVLSSTLPPPHAARRKISPKPKLKRKGSPPPPTPSTNLEEDVFTWQEHEITGHLMMDADDDGTGINGIGFRPTAAIAYARSQKRKQQLSEWKARESKEARQARGERRRKLDGEISTEPSFSGGLVASSNGADRSFEGGTDGGIKRRSVRFV